MVNLCIDKDERIGLEFPGGLMQIKSNCTSTAKNGTATEGVFNHSQIWHVAELC